MTTQQNKPLVQWIIMGLLALTFIAFPILSTDVELPADEPIDLAYGEACIDFYTSGGQDTTFSQLPVYKDKYIYDEQLFYGGLYEMFTVVVSKVVPFDIYKVRHYLAGLVGAFIALFITMIAYQIGGWTMALIALLLTLSSISFMGQTMYNSKDTPFALGMLIGIHYFIIFIKELPRIRVGVLLGGLFGVMLAIGIRIAGVLIFGYLGIFMLYYYIQKYRSKEIESFFTSKEHFWKPTLAAAFMTLVGAFLGFLAYPNFWLGPIDHVLDGLSYSSKFPVKITMLFEGKRILSTQLPSHYLFKYLWITTPLLLWVGLAFFVLFIRRTWRELDLFKVFAVVFTFLFPLGYTIYANLSLYNGWRHVSFLYPPMVLVASIGLYHVYETIKAQSALRIGAIVLLVAFTAKPLAWAVVNHPYEYIYFNELVGEKGFYKQYDTDYQQTGAHINLKALKAHLDQQGTTVNYPITVYTNNEAMVYQTVFPEENIKIVIGGLQGLPSQRWDYAIMSSLFLAPNLFDYTFPPMGKVLNVETVDDYPISYLTQRENNYDVDGLSLIQQNNFGQACPLLQQAYEYRPKNYQIWVALGYCYLNQGDFATANSMADAYLAIRPGDQNATRLKQQIVEFQKRQGR